MHPKRALNFGLQARRFAGSGPSACEVLPNVNGRKKRKIEKAFITPDFSLKGTRCIYFLRIRKGKTLVIVFFWWGERGRIADTVPYCIVASASIIIVLLLPHSRNEKDKIKTIGVFEKYSIITQSQHKL